MSNPSLAVPVQAGGAKGGVRCSLGILGEEIVNLIAQLRGNGFVGVQSKDPVAGGPGCGGIFLSDVAFPRFAENFRAEVDGNFLGAIADIFVQHDNYFAGPLVYTFKSTLDAAGFGSGNHANGDGQLVHGMDVGFGRIIVRTRLSLKWVCPAHQSRMQLATTLVIGLRCWALLFILLRTSMCLPIQ
jgi:hypothetical protein